MQMKKWGWLAVAGLAFTLGAGEVLVEEDFAFVKPGTQMPKGFGYFFSTKLKGEKPNAKFEVRKADDGCEVVFDDQCDKTGIGIQILKIKVDPGASYRATVTAAALPGRETKNVFVKLGSGKADSSKRLDAPTDGSEVTREVDITIPEGRTEMDFFVFSVYDGKPGFVVKSIKIEETKPAPEAPVELKPAAGSKVLLNEDFSAYEVKDGVPQGYHLFYSSKLPKGEKADTKIGIRDIGNGQKALVLEDNCEKTGLGPFRDFPAVGGKTYRLSIVAKPLAKRDTGGAVIQFNLAKSAAVKRNRKDTPAISTLDFTVPEKDSKVRIYVYSNYDRTPAFEIRRILLEELP